MIQVLNLYSACTVIRANILEDVHKQYIMYQLFKALKFMHSAELLHRDIKVLCSNSTYKLIMKVISQFKTLNIQPSNLLLNSECQVKVADFGLARSMALMNKDLADRPVLTDYVATRW